MPQDAPRNDVPPYDGLLDFGSEAPNSPLDTKEPDVALNRDEPDSAHDHGSEPAVIFEIGLNRQERDITSHTRKSDTQPDAYMRPPREPLGQPFVWYTSDSDPVVHRSARRKMGIALLMLAGIGALAWWGRSFIEMGRDAGTSGVQIQNAPQPTPKSAEEFAAVSHSRGQNVRRGRALDSLLVHRTSFVRFVKSQPRISSQ